MLKKKERYETKITSISGFSGRDYEDNLKKFEKELNKKGGYIDGIVTVRAIIIYREKVDE
jgi:hypothetical protein